MDDVIPPPEDVAMVMSMVPKDRGNIIHRSERYQEALQEIVEYCLNMGQRRSYEVWSTLATRLKEKYGIEVTSGTMKDWCVRYVLPNIIIPKSYMLKAIVEKGRSLDLLDTHMDTRDVLEEAFKEASTNLYEHRADGSGRLVRTGANGTELANLAKARMEAAKNIADELERYGVIPERRKDHDVKVGLEINVRGAMAGLSGRSGAVDASFTEKAP